MDQQQSTETGQVEKRTWNARQISHCLRFIDALQKNPPEYECDNPILDCSWMGEVGLLGIDRDVVIDVSRAVLFGKFELDGPGTVDRDSE